MKIKKPRTIAQRIFRDWCASWGIAADVEMAADLVLRIEAAIAAERGANSKLTP